MIALARACGDSVESALIAAGYITADDLERDVAVVESLSERTPEELLREVRRRMSPPPGKVDDMRGWFGAAEPVADRFHDGRKRR